MKLIGNVDYDVTVRMPSGVLNTFRLTYCGGSHVDPSGHYIAGGRWAKGDHPHVLYCENLCIRGIEPVTHGYDGKRLAN